MKNAVLFGKNQENSWLILNSKELKNDPQYYKNYGLTEELVTYALDKNERARMEYEEETDTLLLIFNLPQKEKDDNHFETAPVTFILQNNRLMTIVNQKNDYIISLMEKNLQRNPETSIFKFLFDNLVTLTDLYFPLIEKIDFERKSVNDKLKKQTSKNNLFKLSDLEISTVYLVSAARQNAVLLEQAKKHQIYGLLLNSTEKEQLEDALIEAKQVVEMLQLSSQVLQQLSNSYNTVLNNTLNDTMKILTILSILLTVPTIITGFFGMNMPLPFEHNIYGWAIAILISLVGWFGLSFILSKVLK